MENDTRLIEEFLAGDDQAFNTLLERHIKGVYNFIYQITHDQACLDDLTQVSFIKAWKNIGQFDRKRNFRTWLYSIAKNTALDHLKKKKSIPFSYFNDLDDKSPLDNTPDENILPDELLQREELSENIDRIIDKLPDIFRIVLILRYRDDIDLKEISHILGIPYNTVKSQHQRAILKLRKILDEELHPLA